MQGGHVIVCGQGLYQWIVRAISVLQILDKKRKGFGAFRAAFSTPMRWCAKSDILVVFAKFPRGAMIVVCSVNDVEMNIPYEIGVHRPVIGERSNPTVCFNCRMRLFL